MKTVIHIGLHKTASTYLQNEVFTKLQRNEVIYNPSDLFYFINAIFTLDIKEKKFIDKAKKIAHQYRNNQSNQTLLLSSEGISQLAFVQNYSDNISLLSEIFPEAEIILYLREQSSWLESCYKESIKHHFYQDISTFLNHDGRTFHPSNNRFNSNKMLNMDIHKADWHNLITIIQRHYPSTNHIFFFEDFKTDNLSHINMILKILGSSPIEYRANHYSNIGWSQKSIHTLIKFNKIINKLGIYKSTYQTSYETERADIISNDFFWTPRKPSLHIRLARSLYKEPLRLIKRLSIYNLLKIIDRKSMNRRNDKLITGNMKKHIQTIHSASNNKLKSLLKTQMVPADYKFDDNE